MDAQTKQEKLDIIRQKYDKHEQFIKDYKPDIDWSVIGSNTFGCTQEQNDLLLEDFNTRNRSQMIRELPNMLYIGIYMTNLGDIEQNGLGSNTDHTISPVELFAEQSYALAVVQRCAKEDRQCPFCGEHYYGVIAIATKNLDLSHLSYPELDNTKIYSYTGVIEGKYIKLVEPEEDTE